MKLISTKAHGFFDYTIGILIIASPWLFDFTFSPKAEWVAIIAGILILLTTVLTNFEAGMLKTISMKAHLNIDIVVAVFLTVSPWLLNFFRDVYLPHLVLGLIATGVGIFTEHNPDSR